MYLYVSSGSLCWVSPLPTFQNAIIVVVVVIVIISPAD